MAQILKEKEMIKKGRFVIVKYTELEREYYVLYYRNMFCGLLGFSLNDKHYDNYDEALKDMEKAIKIKKGGKDD